MDFSSNLLVPALAFALGCDAMAVGMAVGTTNPDRRARFRLWFHFGLFQFLMPILGWTMGRTLSDTLHLFGDWTAALLLAIIALKMLHEGLAEGHETESSKDLTRGWSLVSLSLATSMDAMGVGLSMGIEDHPLLKPALVIGIVAGVMTFVGLYIGNRLSARFGKSMEIAGAVLLLAIAGRMLWH